MREDEFCVVRAGRAIRGGNIGQVKSVSSIQLYLSKTTRTWELGDLASILVRPLEPVQGCQIPQSSAKASGQAQCYRLRFVKAMGA